jgi:hypothetical protein
MQNPYFALLLTQEYVADRCSSAAAERRASEARRGRSRTDKARHGLRRFVGRTA